MPQNDTFDWLTYETIFQQKRFARTNEQLEFNLYTMPRDKVTVFFRNDISEFLLKTLTGAIFPDEKDPAAHMKRSNSIWKWKEESKPVAQAPVSPIFAFLGEQWDKLVLSFSPDTNKAHLPTYVVLPYNHLDNDQESKALGTKAHGGYGLKRLKAPYKWKVWKTASRSCVMRVNPKVKEDLGKWSELWQADYPLWDYAAGDSARKDFVFPTDTTGSRYQNFQWTTSDFSIKTGVVYVGKERQTKADKDTLDSNWIIACLRSDYVAETDKKIKRGDKKYKDEIIVLTELLSVNEMEEGRAGEGKKDGIQIRDLSPLDPKKKYLPPLSIPCTDLNFNKCVSEFSQLKDEKWCEFWKEAFAVSLGRAKALFLVRYGLQHINPNVQNYLIEFENKETDGSKLTPTGRMIVRDLQDAALHREIAWALYGPKDTLPPEGKENRKELTKLTLPVLKYEFEERESESCETGTEIDKFGPPGTQFLWQRFSMFGYNNTSSQMVERINTEGNEETLQDYLPQDVKLAADPPVKDKININKTTVFKNFRQQLLAVMADWGKAHNREYIGCIEHQLGVNFRIDWSKLPDRQRYFTQEAPFNGEGWKYDLPKGTATDLSITSITKQNFPGIASLWKNTFFLQILTDEEQKKLLDLERRNKLSPLSGTEADELKDLAKKRDDYFGDLKNKPFTKSCIVIKGTNFPKNVEVFLDGKKAPGVYWRNPGELYIEVNEEKQTYTDEEGDVKERLIYPLATRAQNQELPIKVIDPTGSKEVATTSIPVTELSWEEATIKIVHDYLKSKAGQDAIRAYHARRWEPVKPKFLLRLENKQGKPIKRAPLKFKDKKAGDKVKAEWVDITNSKGEIYFYQGEQADFQFQIPGYDDSISNPEREVSLLDGKPLDLDVVKITLAK